MDTYATVHYVDPARIGADGLVFTFDHAWSGIPTTPHEVAITDASILATSPTLAVEGFQAVEIGIHPVDPADLAQVEGPWRQAVCQAIREATGADAVASWAFGARFSERRDDVTRSEVSNPARRVHGDFSPDEFGTAILHQPTISAIAEVAPGRKLKRWIGINAWQAVSPPPYDTPLALCDRRSVSPVDLVVGTGSVASLPDLSISLPLFAHNPAHRWHYYSAMEPSDVLLFTGIDSAFPGDWHLVPHTAFDNAACPSGSVPRTSIEMRTMALFFE